MHGTVEVSRGSEVVSSPRVLGSGERLGFEQLFAIPGGGRGRGQVVHIEGHYQTAGDVQITIGDGGVDQGGTRGVNGAPSSFDSIVALGGGAGGWGSGGGRDGGSGGGRRVPRPPPPHLPPLAPPRPSPQRAVRSPDLISMMYPYPYPIADLSPPCPT